MSIRKRICVNCVTIGLALAMGGVAIADGFSFENRFQKLTEISMKNYESSRLKASAIQESYRQLFSQTDRQSLNSRPTEDIELLYRAASLASFYSFDPMIVHRMEETVNLLDAKGRATPGHFDELYRAWVSVRDFERARAVFANHHVDGAIPPPTTIDSIPESSILPTIWEVSSTEATLTRKPLNLVNGPRVIVIAHPLCHFTQDAVRDIEGSELGTSLLPISTWIAPQDRRLDIQVFQEWNRKHPSEAMSIVNSQDEWRDFDNWGTPTFYFLKDGVLKDKVVGWPKAGRRGELQAALEKIGVARP